MMMYLELINTKELMVVIRKNIACNFFKNDAFSSLSEE